MTHGKITEISIIEKVTSAIESSFGKSLDYYNQKGKEEYQFFLRMIFAYFCHKNNVHVNKIAEVLNRNRKTVIYYINKYEEEKLNNQFRLLSYTVEMELNKEKSRDAGYIWKSTE